MIETIVMLGVVGNFLLQLHWYLWSRANHYDDKHDTNEGGEMENVMGSKNRPREWYAVHVNKKMREIHFEATGQYSSDKDIYEWYKKQNN